MKTRWLAALVLAASACRADDTARARELASAPAKQLVGVWTARFRLLGAAPLAAADTGDVNATLSLIEDDYGVSTPRLDEASHVGTYVADFSPFGFDLRDRGVIPSAAARVDRDSVTIILGPGEARTVTLRGALVGDSITGTWWFSSRAVGASGTFVMRRYSTIVSGIGLSR